MKGLELRTSEALHRVADGLPVSEDDMDRMEGELITLLETKPSQVRVASRSRPSGSTVRPSFSSRLATTVTRSALPVRSP